MSFDYPHTCPKIDKNITEFKDQLSVAVNEIALNVFLVTEATVFLP